MGLCEYYQNKTAINVGNHVYCGIERGTCPYNHEGHRITHQEDTGKKDGNGKPMINERTMIICQTGGLIGSVSQETQTKVTRGGEVFISLKDLTNNPKINS